MPITAYRVLTGTSQNSLESLVTNAIADGWQPFGTPVANGVHVSQAVIQGTPDGGSGGVVADLTAEDITDSTAVGRSVLTAVDAAAARTALGAGTSNLALGAGATQAKAGNYVPTTAEVGTALKTKSQLVAVAAIATPASATPEQVATSFNSLLAALKA